MGSRNETLLLMAIAGGACFLIGAYTYAGLWVIEHFIAPGFHLGGPANLSWIEADQVYLGYD